MQNESVALRGKRLLLVPYLEQHVPRYHQWMCDPELLEATCSEPLSLEEEYENQKTWLTSSDKLTFIILAPLRSVLSKRSLTLARDEWTTTTMQTATATSTATTATTTADDEGGVEEREIPVTTPLMRTEGSRGDGPSDVDNALDNTYVMVGDCNLFVPPNVEDDGVEIEVMIAEKHLRRHGFAQEALYLLMSYAVRELGHRHFVAKILASNEGSKRLFVNKMHFTLFKEVKVFGEEHFERRLPEGGADMEAVVSVWEKDEQFSYQRLAYNEIATAVQVLQDLPSGLVDQ